MSSVGGAALLELVAVMDRLRSPGGCPWDAEQTHESLLIYALEETYELVEAVETGDRAHLREELGDLLLQVVFHARVATEHPEDPFDLDEVAAGIRDKLVRRHPHVFGTETFPAGHAADAAAVHTVAIDTATVEANWEAIKAVEKGRTSPMDGVPLAQPALALAAKLQSRAERAGVAVPVAATGGDLGGALFALVAAARARGVDPEAALRETCRRFAADVRAAAR